MRSAAVIGAVNIDITGYCENKFIERDSIIGSVKTNIGGVGANIASNMALLGVPTKFVGSIGNDAYRHMILTRFEYLGLDYSKCQFPEDATCGTYLAILDDSNDMVAAINDMKINERTNIDFLSKLELDEEIICVDCNLSQEAFSYALQKFSDRFIIIDAVSQVKCHKILGNEKYINVFRPNIGELASVSGVEITDQDSLIKAARVLTSKGLKTVVVTDGSKGVHIISDDVYTKLDVPFVKPVNTTGAGDSFTAAVAYGIANDMSIIDAARFAMKVSALTIQSEDIINEKIKDLVK